jgi:hypothetical protein
MNIRSAKNLVRHIAPPRAFQAMKAIQRRAQFMKSAGFSEEEENIKKRLDALPVSERYCVDIASQDGVGGSQTLGLFKRGWAGLAVERDAEMFAVLSRLYRVFDNVSLARMSISPDNVCAMLRAAGCPTEFGFLSLDIDGYDHFVLDRLLAEFRPTLACVEINENVPPPLAFTVLYSEDHVWRDDHFQGQSIAKCHELCVKHSYEIIDLHYNNLLIVPAEINPFPVLTPREAYDIGYRNKPDRREKFFWNADMEPILTLDPEAAAAFLNDKFAEYQGRFTLDWPASAP